VDTTLVRYHTRQLGVMAVPVCSKYDDDVSTIPPNLVRACTSCFCFSVKTTCHVCFVKHMMMMRQYLPRHWYDPYPLHAWSRSRSFFSALVCDLLPRRLLHGFVKSALPEEYLRHNFDEHCLEDISFMWCLAYPSGGAPL